MLMSKLKRRVKEHDEYFTIHCGLPASNMIDMFDYIKLLEETIEDNAWEITRLEVNDE